MEIIAIQNFSKALISINIIKISKFVFFLFYEKYKRDKEYLIIFIYFLQLKKSVLNKKIFTMIPCFLSTSMICILKIIFFEDRFRYAGFIEIL